MTLLAECSPSFFPNPESSSAKRKEGPQHLSKNLVTQAVAEQNNRGPLPAAWTLTPGNHVIAPENVILSLTSQEGGVAGNVWKAGLKECIPPPRGAAPGVLCWQVLLLPGS
ncbi:hypothetical protein H1C71_014578 [Ictidomys tridecemlineatus]|nr:hypothetical protein H1C71_014578 [Ictidomys tridecemlineatus]KAG3293104.1 hypothetical protein H1C71_014578 [Ictidomys tridecemlineatus]